MQTQQPPTYHSSYRDPPHLDRTAFAPATLPLSLPAIYTEHCAPAADAAFERCAGRAMQSLSLPPPSSLPATPFGHRPEPTSTLAKLPSHFSPARPESQSYPSPPMSDSHSPARRSAHIVDSEGHQYAHPLHDPRRVEAIAPSPAAPSLLDPRPMGASQGYPQPRPVYPGEPQGRPQPQHYPPGRALEPHYAGMQVQPNYAYGYAPQPMAPYHGSRGPAPGPQTQPTAIIAPPPLRQAKPARRTKAHVASACVNCKKAHLSCDVQRPCGRCVASGKQETCKDVQHKKRGRPRLRDDKEFGRPDEPRAAPSQLMGAPPTSTVEPYPLQSPFATHRAPEPSRVLGSSRDGEVANSRRSIGGAAPGGPPSRMGSFSRVEASPYSAGGNVAYPSMPVAFLNLDLVIHKSNQAFQDLVSFLGDVRGKSLAELLESQQFDVLQRLRGELRDEKDDREPTYMPPITPVGQDPMQSVLQSVSERDIDHFSHGCADRRPILNFRMPNGQSQPLQTQIRLAKTSGYFVTLVVHTPARPPLLTQQLAPPTPTNASQTRSAPTAAPSRDFGPYSIRPASSASSAPTSPYFNFNLNSVRTSLPTISSSSYGNSPSYGYSPTAGPEQGYFPTYQPLSQPGAYPSAFQPASRTGSIISEHQRDANRPGRLEGLQLPPIRTTPASAPPLASPVGHEFGEGVRGSVRPRDSPTSAETRPETPDTTKRRRLNIHEVLE